MNGKKIFETYPFEYHDGNISDVTFIDNDMILSVTRCPMFIKSEEDKNSLFQRLKFKNASNFYLWNDDKNYQDESQWSEMWKRATKEEVRKELQNSWIDDAFFKDGMVVYDYAIRFSCEDIEILESRTNPEYFSNDSWKEQSLQVFFENQLEYRQEIKDVYEGCGDYCDGDEIEFMLLRDFDDTVSFLKSARKQIVALAIWVLEDIAYKLSKGQVQILIDIFKQKKIEFPDIADYCDADYDEEIAIAQSILDNKE